MGSLVKTGDVIQNVEITITKVISLHKNIPMGCLESERLLRHMQVKSFFLYPTKTRNHAKIFCLFYAH